MVKVLSLRPGWELGNQQYEMGTFSKSLLRAMWFLKRQNPGGEGTQIVRSNCLAQSKRGLILKERKIPPPLPVPPFLDGRGEILGHRGSFTSLVKANLIFCPHQSF